LRKGVGGIAIHMEDLIHFQQKWKPFAIHPHWLWVQFDQTVLNVISALITHLIAFNNNN
jgi:hypothetical protein